MKLDFFDVNTFIGRPMNGIFKPAKTGTDLVSEIRSQNISKAITWHILQYECSPEKGNRTLVEEISGHPELYGCWTILPPQTGEIITKDFFRKMKENKIVALNVFPEWHRFILNRISFGEFLDELIERKIPLLLTMDRACLSWELLYGLMKEFPELTCILCDIGIWGVDRFTWPLLEKFPNFYLETSLLSLEEGGLEATVKRFGAERIVFGTGFPVRYPKAAILQLAYADISDEDKEKIASENLENILQEEKL
ncbi:MAG TPA: amidohydrolase family protein [Candidatus Ratteibacteria bacterium]|nr:amidohydrolase family protein [Candidatus Ratteibacteria bacterium]